MPGKVSLAANQYYAHPRNYFWDFLTPIIGVDKNRSYEERTAALLHHKIALWDVLKTCTRPSSLDSDIIESSCIPNEFNLFFANQTHIDHVFFNGSKAESLFKKRVIPILRIDSIPKLTRLPSTSPANASIPYQVKLERWQKITETMIQSTD